jgi:replication factor C subunit 3/5
VLTNNSEKITDITHIPPPDWEALIEQIARQIVEERSPQRLLQVRASLYDLLSHCIDSTTIIKTLTWKLIPKTDDALKPEVIKWAAFYEHRCKMGSKQIFHLEAFVAKYMRIYERCVLTLSTLLNLKLIRTAIPWASTSTRPNHATRPSMDTPR